MSVSGLRLSECLGRSNRLGSWNISLAKSRIWNKLDAHSSRWPWVWTTGPYLTIISFQQDKVSSHWWQRKWSFGKLPFPSCWAYSLYSCLFYFFICPVVLFNGIVVVTLMMVVVDDLCSDDIVFFFCPEEYTRRKHKALQLQQFSILTEIRSVFTSFVRLLWHSEFPFLNFIIKFATVSLISALNKC